MEDSNWLKQFIKNNDDIRELEFITKQSGLLELKKDTIMFKHGDPCKGFVWVLSGCIRVEYLDEQGNAIVLYRVHPGESCTITTGCLLGNETYPAEGIVDKTVRAVFIPNSTFQQAMSIKAFRDIIFTTLGQRISDLMKVINEVAFKRIDVRLASFLSQQAPVLYATQQEISVELGTAREVVSRSLKKFEQKKWVKVSRGCVEIIDANALRNHSQQF